MWEMKLLHLKIKNTMWKIRQHSDHQLPRVTENSLTTNDYNSKFNVYYVIIVYDFNFSFNISYSNFCDEYKDVGKIYQQIFMRFLSIEKRMET